MMGRPFSNNAKCILLHILRVLRKEQGYDRPIGIVTNLTRMFKLLTGYDLSTALCLEKSVKLQPFVSETTKKCLFNTLIYVLYLLLMFSSFYYRPI